MTIHKIRTEAPVVSSWIPAAGLGPAPGGAQVCACVDLPGVRSPRALTDGRAGLGARCRWSAVVAGVAGPPGAGPQRQGHPRL